MTTENTSDTSPQRPIGYWLRLVDGLISAELDDAFASEGVDRRDWMLLSVLAGDVDVPPFAAKRARRGRRLGRLEERGWADEQSDGSWTLTDEGRAAKERLGAIVDGVRERIAAAVSPEDFATTMASLEAIARELGGDAPDARVWRHGRGFGRPFGRRGAPDVEHDGPRGRFGHGPFGPGRFGHPAFRPGHGPHGHRCATDTPHVRDSEHAFERGFEAGLSHGRSA